MKNYISFIIKSLLVSFTLSFDIYALYGRDYNNLFNIGYLFIFVLFFIFLFLFKKDNKKSNYVINILSIIFSFFMIFGYSYMKLGNSNLVFDNLLLFVISIIMAISYFLIFQYFLKLLFYYLDSKLFLRENRKLTRFRLLLDKHPFIVSLAIILICWLPYVIAFYPGILSPDPSFQIRQFFGIWTKYNEYSVMIDESVLITNHHPVIHTLLLGGCLKIGNLLGNDNFGIFICSFIQLVFLANTLSYTIKYMSKLGIVYKYRVLSLLVYAFIPMFPLYSISLVKDVIFTCFVIYFIIFIHKLVKNDFNGIKDYLLFILIMMGMILFRNNGIHVIIITFVFLLLILKEYRKYCLFLFIIVLSFSMCYTNAILPYFKITPSSIRETLSIPFQQTARYVKYYEDELNENEIKVIDNILDISDLGDRYDPEISDPVKNKFNKYATRDDLRDYFGVWFDCFIKHPYVYIDATINNTYGYFYPNKTNWYVYHSFDDRIVKNGFDYHYNSLNGMRSILSGFGVGFPSIPGIGMISNIGFNVWCMFIMFGYLIFNKKYRETVILVPGFVILLVCVASPVNCYFRYAMPFVFAMPLMIGFLLDFIKDLNKGEV